MTENLRILIPILLIDIVNPVLFAFMVYAAGSRKPIATSTAALLGHSAAYFLCGIVLAVGMENITDRLMNPRFIDYVISLIVGVLLIPVSLRSSKDTGKKQQQVSQDLSPVKAFGLGAVINFMGIPFALPYFAALDQILKAEFSTVKAVTALSAYNVFYALPFLVVPVTTALLGERSRPMLEKINNKVDRVSGFLMPFILFILGVSLIADAVVYFAAGKGLFQ